MITTFFRILTVLQIALFPFFLMAQEKGISIHDSTVFVNNITTAEVEIIEPSFETFRKHMVKLYLVRKIDINTLRQIKKKAKNHYIDKLNTKKVVVKVQKSEKKQVPDSIRKARENAFYDYIFQRLESEELNTIEGVYESIDEGNDFEYQIVILKSTNDIGAFESYLLASSDPELPVSLTFFKLRPSAVPNKYLTQYWLKNGYTTSNQLTIYNEGILNAGPKSFIKMYPSPNETRKYREINPMVDWESCGSGVLLGGDGIVATNHHVIDGANKIRVKIADSGSFMEYEAALIAQNIESDIALLRIIDTTNFVKNIKAIPLKIDISMGQEVMTLGYPIPDKMGENVKFNKGYVSALTGNDNRKNYFQTDLPVWYGNSGGPCFDKNGNLMGLVSEIRFDRGQKLENVCFVTSVSNLVSLIQTTKYNHNITLNNRTEKANMTDLISRSVFIKVN